MTTPYITRLTDFSGEEEETDYFSDPNAIIQLQNEFNTIKQNTGKTVTQYLARFNRIHRQIEAIEQRYYTDPQVLNQFIRGLKSSILGRVRPVHPNSLPEAVMLARALESAEKEANHSQMVNMVMEENKTETLEKRVTTKNFSKLSQTIPLAVATEDSSLAAIFPFELEKNEAMFSGAALDKKCPITAMYTEATVNNTPIKLILDSGSAGSIVMLQLVNQLGFKVDRATMSQIITADGSTKLPHGEIDSFPFEINGIVIPTKVLVMDATQYQALAKIPATCGHFQKPSANQRPTFEFEENSALPAIETYQLSWADDQRTELPAIPTWTSEERSKWNQVSLRRNHQRRKPKLECLVCKKKLLSMTACSTPDEDPRNPIHYYCNRCNKEKYGYPERHGKWDKEPCLACGEPLPRGCDWNDLPGRGEMCDTTCQYTILICDWIRRGTPFEAVFNRALKRLQHYPHNEDELYNTAQAKSAEVADEVTSYNMFDPQEQYLAQINTYLCENCLIPCQNQCCEECQDKKDLEKKMEIENQQSQNQSINQQNSPDGPESEKFVAYTDLEQMTDIRYFDNGHLGIILERAHLTDAGFDLHYPEDQFTTLPPRSITKIDLKIAVEILPGIMVQMASRSSLAKKRISVQERVIDSEYTGNLMVLLQNNSEKPYTIESKEKIAQAIFLSLVKIGKFVPVENREELSQTTRETFGFRSTRKGIEANFAETIEEKGKVIKNEQSIMLLPYGKSEIRIKRTIKEKNLIFEPYPETCQQFLIGLTNLFIPADKA
ncbi:hypothetical protein G9A89_023812 [Geosiphon pyriformis]|nr:hypothetical protein G9A89_023812 [Geosiphon pyriformis]